MSEERGDLARFGKPDRIKKGRLVPKNQPTFIINDNERKTRLELATLTLARLCSTN